MSPAVRSASCRILDPDSGGTLVDSLGRRWFTTSITYGPSVGKNILMAYLPHDYCQPGRKLAVDYFGETYPVEVAKVGAGAIHDPEHSRVR